MAGLSESHVGLSLSADAFCRVFPFHIAFDRDLRITQTGPSLLRLCPRALPGTALAALFSIERPTDGGSFEDIAQNSGQVFVLSDAEGRFRLRGQMLLLPEVQNIAFLCSPWLASPQEMGTLALTLNDFAIHDPVVDFVQVMQLHLLAVEDLKELASRLATRRKALTLANQKLENQFQELKKAQALTKSILETAPDGYLVTSLNGGTVSFNLRFLEMWEIPPELTSQKAPGVLRQFAERLVRDPNTFCADILQLFADPELESQNVIHLVNGRVYDRHSKPQRLGSEVIGRVWTYRDITLQWRAQEELRLSEERYRVVAEGASDGILTIDTSSRILFANAVCERIFGYSPAELSTMYLTDLMPPEAREQHTRGFGSYLQSGVRKLNWQVVPLEGLHRNGNRVQLELSFGESVVEGKHWFTSIVRDVTERRKTARALEASEKRYRTVVNNIQEVIFQTDKVGRWTFLNPAWAHVRGENELACLGKRTANYIHPEDRSEALRVFRELMAGRIEEARHTLRFLRTDGSIRWAEIVARALLDDSGSVIGIAGTMTDITERREWQQRREDARVAAESANLAKTEFLASISHEIRTPLNAIVGMSELMAETTMTEEQKDYQSTVRASAESLLHLIDDLLDVSRIEAGKIDVYAAPFDPSEVCEESVNIVQSRAKQKNLGLYLYANKALPPFVIGDRNRVRQILINLLTNAIKFTTEGFVAAELEWAIEADEFVDLVLRIRDTGPGISEGDRARIFDKFVQLGPASRLSSGAGLGLAISRSLATAMGANILIDSTAGRGSTFTLAMKLPRTAKRPVEDLLFLQRCERLSVLLLAQPASLSQLRPMLEAWGIRPDICEDAVEAVKCLRHTKYHLFVGDATLNWHGNSSNHLMEALTAADGLSVLLVPHQGTNARKWLDRLPHARVIEQPALPSRIQRALRRVMGEYEVPASPPARTLRNGGRPAARLLVAEDNPENQRLIQRILEGAGYQVDVASDGSTTAEMAAEFRYDAILMDLQMPGLDGFEATTAIRKHEAAAHTGNVPIIALTAHALTAYRERSLAAGMNGFLTKPVLREYLLNLLQDKIDWRPLILAVDDDPSMLQIYQAHVKSFAEWRLITASGAAEAIAAFDQNNVALLLVDVELDGASGLDVARHVLSAARPAVPVVAISGHTGQEISRLVRTAGCVERLEKPLRRETLLATLTRYAPGAPQTQLPEFVEVDPDLSDLIPSLLEDIHVSAATMATLCASGDLEGVRKLAHRVKGAAGGYNFHTITAMGRAIENNAIAGDLAGASRVIGQLDEYISNVKWRPGVPSNFTS